MKIPFLALRFASRFCGIGAIALVAAASTARATVSLNFSDCSTLKMPTISSDDTSILSGPYRLRCKIIDGSQYGFHAATSYQNNGKLLDQLPGAGTYSTAALYYVTYTDYSYSTVASIGPEVDTSMSISTDAVWAPQTYQGGSFNWNPVGVAGWDINDGSNSSARVRFDGAVVPVNSPSGFAPYYGYQINLTDNSTGVTTTIASGQLANGSYDMVVNVPYGTGSYNLSFYVTSPQSYSSSYWAGQISNVRISTAW